MDQVNQVFKNTEGIISEAISALSWNIATDPKLHQQLAPNPYHPAALQIIAKRFFDKSAIDVIRAVVLAEPEGSYDRNFNLLGPARKARQLNKQTDITKKIYERITQYCKTYTNELRLLPKDVVYSILCLVVFETDDRNKIERNYSQKQRREFRLLIVNFIEELFAMMVPRSRLSLKWPLLLMSFSIFCCVPFFYLAGTFHEREVEKKQFWDTSQVKEELLKIATLRNDLSFPVRLKIPRINVDARIQYVGLTAKGIMGVPDNTIDVGWFDLGPRPGERGSAVIAGHFDGENGTTGVFTNLYKLQKGDTLYIQDGKGTMFAFVVQKSDTYNPGYANAVFNATDSAHLNLITCEGIWDKSKKSYTKRLVVFTDIVH